MMLALAALDLPFEAATHGEELDGLRYALATAASPLVAFHREILEAARADEPDRCSWPSTSSAPTTATASKTTSGSTSTWTGSSCRTWSTARRWC